MSGLLAVLPIITPDYALPCLDSILRPDSSSGLSQDEILIVDNSRDGLLGHTAHGLGFTVHRDPSGHNLGVARSWNVGVRRVLDEGLDYIILMSATVLFGPILHTTWKRQMEEFWGARVIESDGLSWKLIAIHRSAFERIGIFDENFYPAYFEQTDWCYRLRMVGWEQGFVRVWCNAMAQAVAGHNHVVSCPAQPLLDYYRSKFGGDKGEETWVMPFGNKPLDYWEDVPIPVLAERYGLETWW